MQTSSILVRCRPFGLYEQSNQRPAESSHSTHALGTACSGKRTPLHEAAKRDDVEAVKLLMKHGAEITATNRSEWSFACVLRYQSSWSYMMELSLVDCLFVQMGIHLSNRLSPSTRLEVAKVHTHRSSPF